MTTDDIDPLDERVRNALVPGERVVWSGRPDPSVMFTQADIYLVPISLAVSLFTAFWVALAAAPEAPLGFRLFISPFVVGNAYLLFGRFIAKRVVKQQTRYVLTDRRAFIIRPRSVKSWYRNSQPIEARRNRSGSHVSVFFGPPIELLRQLGRMPNTGLDLFTRYRNFPPGRNKLRPLGYIDMTVGFFDVEDDGSLVDALRWRPPPPPPPSPPPSEWAQWHR